MTLPNTIHTIRKSPPRAKHVKKQQRHVQAVSFDPQRKQQDLETIQRELAAFCTQQMQSLDLVGVSPETPLTVHAKREAPTNPPPAPSKHARTKITRATTKSQTKQEPDSDDEWDVKPKQEEKIRVREESKQKRADEDENEEEEEDLDENEDENEDENQNVDEDERKCASESESEYERPRQKITSNKTKQNKQVIEDGIKRRTKLPKQAVDKLLAWFLANKNNPYPNDKEKARLADETGLTSQQIQNWFTNTRKRRWVPHVQGMNQTTSPKPKKKFTSRRAQSKMSDSS